MGKSQARGQTIISMLAGDTIPAGSVVGFLSTSVANTVYLPDTTTALIIGVAAEYADSGTSIPIIIGGTAKCIATASISTGTLVVPDTGTGKIDPFTGTVTTQPTVGVALENGSASARVEIALQIRNVHAG